MEDGFERLIGKSVRVIFDDPGDPNPEKRGKVWKGRLLTTDGHFIELMCEGRTSLVNRSHIIAISEDTTSLRE